MGGWSVRSRRRVLVRAVVLTLCAGGVVGALLLYRTGPVELHHAFLQSRHVRTYPVLLRPRACPSPRPLSLLLAVKSQAGHAQRRAALRDTWGRAGPGVCAVFLLGREGAGPGAVGEESRRHGDILQWDFEESFFNVTLKELLFWRWFSREPAGSAPYVLRADDDVFVDVGGVLALLRLHRPGPAHPLYMGHAFVGTYPVRLWWNKYYVPRALHQGPYPPYLGGGGYLVSRETIRLLLAASSSVPLFPIDDVYVGMCAWAANVTAQDHPGFMPFEFSPSLPPCSYAGALVLHRLEPEQLLQLWGFHKQHRLSCGPAVTVPPGL